MVRLNIPKNTSGIYKIQSIVNGKIYVGSAVDFKKRKNLHWCSLKNKKHGNSYLQHHVNKYSIDDLFFHIIEVCEKENLIVREQYYIDTLKPEFNLSPTAGNNLGVIFNAVVRKKISDSQKGKIIPPEQRLQISQTLKGNIPWNKGKTGVMPIPWNKGTEGVMIAWNAGKKATPEAIQHQSDSHKGIKPTEEQKQKQSISIKKTIEERGGHWNVGFHQSEETKEKIRAFQKGRKKSDKMKAALSLSTSGHSVSQKTRDKISETKRKNKAA